jgi:hypothetical protein
MKNNPQLMRRCKKTKKKQTYEHQRNGMDFAGRLREKSQFKFRGFIYQLFFSIIMKPDNANCPQSKL